MPERPDCFSGISESPLAERIGEPELPEALCERELGTPGLAAFGGDDNHAVGRFRSVDRRGRSPLQDLDVRNVGRVQIGDAVDGVVLALRVAAGARRGDRVHVAGDRVIRDDQPVHHDERIDAAVDGRNAAQCNLPTTTRSPRVHLHQRAGDLALQGAFDGPRGRPGQHFGRYRGDRVGQVALLHSRRLSGHHDRLEVEDVLVQGDVRLALIGPDRHLSAFEPDGAHQQPDRTLRRGQRVLTALVGYCDDDRTQHGHVGAGDRLPGGCARDPSGDDARLRSGVSRAEPRGDEHQHSDEQCSSAHVSLPLLHVNHTAETQAYCACQLGDPQAGGVRPRKCDSGRSFRHGRGTRLRRFRSP